MAGDWRLETCSGLETRAGVRCRAGDRCRAGHVRRAGVGCRAGHVTWTRTNVDRDSVWLALRTNGRLNLKAFIDRPTVNPPINSCAPGVRGYVGFSVGLQLEQKWKLESPDT